MAPLGLSRAAQKLPASPVAVRIVSMSEALSRINLGLGSAGKVSSAPFVASLNSAGKWTLNETIAASAPLRDVPPLHQNGNGARSLAEVWEGERRSTAE